MINVACNTFLNPSGGNQKMYQLPMTIKSVFFMLLTNYFKNVYFKFLSTHMAVFMDFQYFQIIVRMVNKKK